MTISTQIKEAANLALRPLNLRLETYTANRLEDSRVQDAHRAGQFASRAYKVPECVRAFDPNILIQYFEAYRDDLAAFLNGTNNHTQYSPDNSFFSHPDAEVLYLLVRGLQPKRIIEIGCGNSTRITKQAIKDGALKTDLVCIDPLPRADINGLPSQFVQSRAEGLAARAIYNTLEAGDILFIDSSHEVKIANDCAYLFCNLIPQLPAGVVVHVHDCFLPYEYPLDWALAGRPWGEQYLLQLILLGFSPEILWPGYLAQHEMHELRVPLPFLSKGRAQSFWMRWRGDKGAALK